MVDRYENGLDGFSASSEGNKRTVEEFLASQAVAEMDSEEALASGPEAAPLLHAGCFLGHLLAVMSALSERPKMVQTPGRTLSCTPRSEARLPFVGGASGQ